MKPTLRLLDMPKIKSQKNNQKKNGVVLIVELEAERFMVTVGTTK